MKRKRASKILLATMASAFLFAGAAMGADERLATRGSVTRVSPSSNARTEARRSMTFKSEQTDSWLCNYVSPLFCSNLVPTLESRPDGPTPSTSTPVRGRK